VVIFCDYFYDINQLLIISGFEGWLICWHKVFSPQHWMMDRRREILLFVKQKLE
jgi:hypothetical protein